MTTDKTSVLIVGAGEFGTSTAVSLLRTGKYSKVTVIDRAPVLPAVDAASTDINKVVRWDYSDADYCRLAREAIVEWNKPEWKGIYHQCGVVVRSLESEGQDGDFGRKALANVKPIEPSVTALDSPEDITRKLAPSPDIPVATFPSTARGYHNPVGGWVHASKAVEKLYEFLAELGGEIVPGAEMTELVLEDDGRDVRGVRCKDGREFYADKVIVALGSWTPSHPALKKIVPQDLIVATGQAICAVQLSPEDAQRYAKIPVTMNFDGSGFYSFPPNSDGMLKFAIHGAGYISETGVPRTAADANAVVYSETNQVGWIPEDSLQVLRTQLASVYPELAKMPITYTRMCWYSDVIDGNWVFDFAPQYPSLFCASGGSGHAFKFLPIIGNLIRSRFEDTLEPHLEQKWRMTRQIMTKDPARPEMVRKPLDLNKLVKQNELRRTVGGSLVMA